MAKYKERQCNGVFVPVVFEEQLQVGTFEWALNHLVDHELDFAPLDKRFRNDVTGATAYDPRTLTKIVLLGYSRGLISSRKIERACVQNTVFMAIGGGAQPSYGQIAKFVRLVAPDLAPLFGQVLQTCDRLGLIGKAMFAIDGVKLPCNASKERSGTFTELKNRARRLDAAAEKLLTLHQQEDIEGPTRDPQWCEKRVADLRREAQVTRDFVERTSPRLNTKKKEIKSNITDPDSAKMMTSKGAIQGYAAQATVDSDSQIIVAADVIGSGAEQSMLIPMIDQASPYLQPTTLITADAGYFSDANVKALCERDIPAMIADTAMRKRDERFRNAARFKAPILHDKRPIKVHQGQIPISEFTVVDECTILCPEGKTLRGIGTIHITKRGVPFRRYEAQASDCASCPRRSECQRNFQGKRGRQIAIYLEKPVDRNSAPERMKRAIDSERGRRLYSQRVGTVEPVFANLRHHKAMNRFTVRGKAKVCAQWKLYCMVHNIEKLAKHL
jgi:transposase